MSISLLILTHRRSLVYLDKLLVFRSTLAEHNKNFIAEFDRLGEVNIKINLSKSHFFKKELLFLGYFISQKL